jgi:methylglutaconyl-CoA hydratase
VKEDPNTYDTLSVTRTGGVARVFLNRPDVRNAFNEVMIADVTDVFRRLGQDKKLRAIVFGGEGHVFCAGADVDWMRRSAERTEMDNVADAEAMARMYRTIDECPVPVVCRVQKAAFGGALGLLCVSDVVIAEAGAKFCFSEVRLGLIPAVISTFCIERIGTAAARRYMLTAEVFTAAEAPPGLVHEAVPAEELDSKVGQIVDALLQTGPQAVREIKALIPQVAALSHGEAIQLCARAIARIRVGNEAQIGLHTFLSKQIPPWQKPGTGES